MQRSILPIRRSILSKSQPLLQYFQIQCQSQNPISCPTRFLSEQPSIQPQTRSFGSMVNESTVENNLIRSLRRQIRSELEHSPLDKPPSDFHGFEVAEHPGEQWIALAKKFRKNEDINIKVTMFNGSVPIPTEGGQPDERGEEYRLHVTMKISILKEETNQVLEFICSAWPDTLKIQMLFVRDRSKMLSYEHYTGPKFRELNDQLQESLYNFLEERGVDDNLCAFLHKYMYYKDRSEYIRWMESVSTAIEK